ncbi:MAG: dTDP-4-dehydrorhamnose reductase [Methanogenium sp.]|nr:dTDP-4-dehydrorhamnose reductase [Methanogenium sp.]
MEPKVLILGANGMLGHDLQKVFPDAVCKGHELDISDETAISSFISKLKPDIVINAAAYTNVDGCEENQELAFTVNGKGPGYVAAVCKKVGAVLVHFSTDYVFDGSHEEYIESDTPNPINVYGRSKLLGEQNIIKNMDDYRIVRTSWLFGKNGKNFVETMLNLSKEMDNVKVVNDQFGKPTYTADLAEKVPEIIGYEPGIYHVTNEGVCSWYEFAQAIITNVVPCSSEEFTRPAKRPKYSVLINTKTNPMQDWKNALSDYLNQN